MAKEMSTWIIISLAVLGVGAAIAEFLRTPRERRYRVFPQASLDEQLKNCPVSAEAVIIKGSKARALVKWVPYIFIGAVLVGFTLWRKSTGNVDCTRLLGINTTYILLLLVCYGLPIGLLVVSSLFVGTGLKTIKTGYFPPLDSVVFKDTIAKKGTISTLRGVVLLVLPVFTLFIVYLGNNAYTVVAGGQNMHEIIEKLEAKCQ
ncbi:hypothetical protein [Methylobacter sp.]|uniref:hypothetical protein n=1 Tax=Methylobacter sp. TaxID=2051955 RepID=UPI003DA6AE4B